MRKYTAYQTILYSRSMYLFPNKFIGPSVSTLLQNVNKKAVTFSVYSTRQIIVATAVAE